MITLLCKDTECPKKNKCMLFRWSELSCSWPVAKTFRIEENECDHYVPDLVHGDFEYA
jgi:hypothetical protein